jgi:hypothetical protein
VTTPEQLRSAISEAMKETRPVVVNVMIEPSSKKKLVSYLLADCLLSRVLDGCLMEVTEIPSYNSTKLPHVLARSVERVRIYYVVRL